MSYRGFKVWLIATVTLLTLAAMIILSYWIRRATSWDGLIMLIFLVIALVALYILAIRFIMRPERGLLGRTWFKVVVSTVLTLAIGSGVIHYLRFIPSPEGATLYSKTVATLLTVSGLSAYVLLILFLWKGLKKDIEEPPDNK